MAPLTSWCPRRWKPRACTRSTGQSRGSWVRLVFDYALRCPASRLRNNFLHTQRPTVRPGSAAAHSASASVTWRLGLVYTWRCLWGLRTDL